MLLLMDVLLVFSLYFAFICLPFILLLLCKISKEFPEERLCKPTKKYKCEMNGRILLLFVFLSFVSIYYDQPGEKSICNKNKCNIREYFCHLYLQFHMCSYVYCKQWHFQYSPNNGNARQSGEPSLWVVPKCS